MILALTDFILFKLEKGKHSKVARQERFPINLSWEGNYEPVIVEILEEGDLIFTSERTFLSWLVQYFTKTDISHIATYIGDGRVFHATLSGMQITPLKSFFGSGKCVMPLSTGLGKSKKEKSPGTMSLSEYVESMKSVPYNKKLVVSKGIRTLFGVPWRKFRWAHAIDVTMLVVAVSLLFLGSNYLYLATPLLFLYYSVLALSYLFRRVLSTPLQDPGEAYLPFVAEKIGRPIPSPKKINEQWFKDNLMKSTQHEGKSREKV